MANLSDNSQNSNLFIEGEIWKPVVGYEGLYEVSNLGRVKSVYRKVSISENKSREVAERILSASLKSLYPMVALSKSRKSTTKYIHRLLSEAFIPNPLNKKCVNHIDGDKKNNDLENLEWVSYGENAIHAYGTGLRKISDSHKIIMRLCRYNSAKPIIQINLETNLIVNEWRSRTIAAKAIGIPISAISKCCMGIRKSINGYSFQFKDK